MNAVGRLWIRLKRFRHRRGYGVHSPFAFDFLTFVVYERGEYYAYRDLTGRHPVSVFQRNGHLVKCRKFLFRLANYVHPAVIRLVGNVKAAEADYLSAGWAAEGAARKVELVCLAEDVPPAEWKAWVAGPSSESSACLIVGPYRSEESRRAWEDVKRLDAVVVSFDLYDYGLVFYDRSKQRQHYIVNF